MEIGPDLATLDVIAVLSRGIVWVVLHNLYFNKKILKNLYFFFDNLKMVNNNLVLVHGFYELGFNVLIFYFFSTVCIKIRKLK